jgi:ferredoxin
MVKNSRRFRQAAAFLRFGIALVFLALWLYAWFSPGIASNGMLAFLARTQFSSALYGKGAAAFAVLAILLSAFFFGRAYCSVLCPLGTLQELCWRAGKVIKRWGKSAKAQSGLARNPAFFRAGYVSVSKWRYALLALAGIGAAFAFAPLLMAFDPISNFGRGMGVLRDIAHNGKPALFALLAALPPAAILLISFFRGRFFCDWCPVGQLLGLCSQAAPFGAHIAPDCASCGNCEKKCPVGCINAGEKRIENSRCVLCLSCVSVCPAGSISLLPVKKVPQAEKAGQGESRRRFLKTSLSYSLAAGAAYLLGPSVKIFGSAPPKKAPGLILPPGAKSWKHYSGRCVGCQACVVSCPARVIRVQAFHAQPSLDYRVSGCQYNCVECGSVCPSGAIRRLSIEEKHRTRVALSALTFERCVVSIRRDSCGACAEVCPTGAITMVSYTESGIPRLTRPLLDQKYCTGCGSCFAACPASPKAIAIDAVDEQILTVGTRPSEESGDELKIEGGDDFPF